MGDLSFAGMISAFTSQLSDGLERFNSFVKANLSDTQRAPLKQTGSLGRSAHNINKPIFERFHTKVIVKTPLEKRALNLANVCNETRIAHVESLFAAVEELNQSLTQLKNSKLLSPEKLDQLRTNRLAVFNDIKNEIFSVLEQTHSEMLKLVLNNKNVSLELKNSIKNAWNDELQQCITGVEKLEERQAKLKTCLRNPFHQSYVNALEELKAEFKALMFPLDLIPMPEEKGST